MKIFIDESGDSNIEKIDPKYPLLTLGALIIDEANLSLLENLIKEIKRNHFVDESFIFHSAELTRPNQQKSDKRNSCMTNTETRRTVYDAIDKAIKSTEISTVFCTIDLLKFKNKYEYPADAYHIAFENIINRIFLLNRIQNNIYIESRAYDKDQELQTSYKMFAERGTMFVTPDLIREQSSLTFKDKGSNIIGLQIIDLMLTPYVRNKLEKTEKPLGNGILLETVKSTIFKESRFPY